jgi:DNA polymerase III delta prime subunit
MENFMLKFQPLYFSDFEIDKNIIDILDTLIKINNINILFIGDIGSGKTSLLNALVREYYKNVEPKVYLENILHINNLKEQGINYYRTEVKTFCQTGSTIKHKKKIIMLDDIDFINEQSQQVFRNCMDKFNNNVHFIASSGNIQKVIESLQSRFIIIKLNQLQKLSMSKILTKIKMSKNINITPDAENFILDISNNSAKKLINYMEKIKLLNSNITFENANQICTDISFLKLEEYSGHIKNKRLTEAVKLIYSIYDNGYSVIDILDNYFTFIKITNIFEENEKYEIISFICKYITIFYNIHEDEIELSLITNNLINLLGK